MKESSCSEAHLASLSSNPATSSSAEVERKTFTEPTHVPAGWRRNNSDMKESLSLYFNLTILFSLKISFFF